MERPELHLNGKVADLRVIRMHRQLQDPDVAKDLAAVEAPNGEEATVVEDGAVVAAAARRQAIDAAAIPRHGDEVEEQHVVGVLVAVVAANDEEVGADEGGRVGQAAAWASTS
ncbi:hypothetical protein BN1723_008075 [Verticillium longisporum]|uniref:Uncharacterized protein n=1 Tax=Verticillium longisporum TaxID=100787 RepID=A0A0G4NPZ6_VERLO|nr:hypothetical protein BN1723_008075 [Verticillium longisporum]